MTLTFCLTKYNWIHSKLLIKKNAILFYTSTTLLDHLYTILLATREKVWIISNKSNDFVSKS